MKYTILVSLASLLIITTTLQTTHLAANSSTCLPPGLWNASALTCVCQNGSVFDTVLGSCICLPATPWIHNGICQACNFPDIFDNLTKHCYICPHGYAYNLTVHYCQSIVCPPGQTYNVSIHNCSCPSSNPYAYNNTCNKCPLNNFVAHGKCQPCWKGSFYNTTSKFCQCD